MQERRERREQEEREKREKREAEQKKKEEERKKKEEEKKRKEDEKKRAGMEAKEEEVSFFQEYILKAHLHFPLLSLALTLTSLSYFDSFVKRSRPRRGFLGSSPSCPKQTQA